MSTRLERINEERELLNYEYFHLYNMVKHGGRSRLFPRRKLIQRNANNDQSEYGLVVDSNGKKRIWNFLTLKRCQQEQGNYPGSLVVRLGRDSKSTAFDVLHIENAAQIPDPRFLAHADESGNIETPETEVLADVNVYQLISNELTKLGFVHTTKVLDGMECPVPPRPPAKILRDLHVRYNDIVPEDFASAVVRHCEVPPSYRGGSDRGKSSWKTPEEKATWFDTPAGQAWVKENPVPSIFDLPVPEYMHRRG